MRGLFLALVALIGAALAFNVPAPTPSKATVAVSTPIKMSFSFEDVGLDNTLVTDDPDLVPARKCASCFG